MRYIILGTAGHIDHGKSSLVKALTGTDPDRLKEEKERGITIDLGFADLSYPDGLTVGIVDVPGHERLVRNMLAGAGGIDLVLLVIAADEGIMPQSREHLAICNLLNIKSGIVAITKADLVEKDWLDLVAEEVRNFVKGTFLDGAEMVPVSSKTGYNLDLLTDKIRAAALAVEPKPVNEIVRLPIDRVFTMKGFGTVVTGTLFSGSLSVEESVEILPSGLTSKVRGLHSHGRSLQTVYAGQRVAINLQGIDKEALKRGDVVVTPKTIVPTQIIDARIKLLKDSPLLKSKSSVHLHMTTSETIARIIFYDHEELKPGDSCYCQLRLNDPVVAFSGDRFVVRRFSPVITIGGGTVLDPSPARRTRREGIADLEILENGTLQEKIATKVKKSGLRGADSSTIMGWVKAEIPTIEDSIKQLKKQAILIQLDTKLFHRAIYDALSLKIRETLSDFHKRNPLSPGMPKEELRTYTRISSEIWNNLVASLNALVVDRDIVRLRDFTIASSDADASSQKVLQALEKAKFQPPSKEELAGALSISPKAISDILKLMTTEGKLIRINDSLHIPSSVYQELLSLLRIFFAKQPTMTVAEFRDILSTSRKYALPFLEYLDSHKITLRVGDVRKLLLKAG
ncbi:MAG TPA: selenocysteine-specific translation elongation factor [Nitrospiraceae bacterium]|jgi:selenocysteine-specific elongation factor|nr:selenocysteine-specific translation elongation factor [Nitrospiraceae bacterium]